MIIWDEATQKVECLFPQQALDVLDDLRESTTWENEPFCLSWNSYMLPFSEEKRKEWRVTNNRRNQTVENESALNCLILSPEQTRELFVFLGKHENEIRVLGDAYAKEARKILGRLYSTIIGWGRDRLERNQDSK